MQHYLVAGEPGKFAGWPANNGVWMWDGREILVGFTLGDYEEKKGHNIVDATIVTLLARSRDGGETWQVEHPQNYVGQGQAFSEPPGGIRFSHPDFAMRLIGISYHGVDDPEGGFFFSYDRGRAWQGPYTFRPLMAHPQLRGMECTARTNYIVTGEQTCLLFMSARKPDSGMSDRAFLARTTDGGQTFDFVSWIVSYDDPWRALMPAPVQCSPAKFVVALRRRNLPDNDNWIDAYGSEDAGASWRFLSRVGEAGRSNGNPPALLRLADGRLCCVYGNRTRRVMLARLSRDEGATWGDEVVLRDDYQTDAFDDDDFGYPRLVQRADGKLVTMYYWATAERPHHFIAATVWQPEDGTAG